MLNPCPYRPTMFNPIGKTQSSGALQKYRTWAYQNAALLRLTIHCSPECCINEWKESANFDSTGDLKPQEWMNMTRRCAGHCLPAFLKGIGITNEMRLDMGQAAMLDGLILDLHWLTPGKQAEMRAHMDTYNAAAIQGNGLMSSMRTPYTQYLLLRQWILSNADSQSGAGGRPADWLIRRFNELGNSEVGFGVNPAHGLDLLRDLWKKVPQTKVGPAAPAIPAQPLGTDALSPLDAAHRYFFTTRKQILRTIDLNSLMQYRESLNYAWNQTIIPPAWSLETAWELQTHMDLATGELERKIQAIGPAQQDREHVDGLLTKIREDIEGSTSNNELATVKMQLEAWWSATQDGPAWGDQGNEQFLRQRYQEAKAELKDKRRHIRGLDDFVREAGFGQSESDEPYSSSSTPAPEVFHRGRDMSGGDTQAKKSTSNKRQPQFGLNRPWDHSTQYKKPPMLSGSENRTNRSQTSLERSDSPSQARAGSLPRYPQRSATSSSHSSAASESSQVGYSNPVSSMPRPLPTNRTRSNSPNQRNALARSNSTRGMAAPPEIELPFRPATPEGGGKPRKKNGRKEGRQ